MLCPGFRDVAANRAPHHYYGVGAFATIRADQVTCDCLLIRQGKRDEALPLLDRALAIRLDALGETHKDTVEAQARLDRARQPQVTYGTLRVASFLRGCIASA